jgi:hypothetical protein
VAEVALGLQVPGGGREAVLDALEALALMGSAAA